MENESILVSVFPLAFTVVDHFTTLPLPLWDYFTLLKKRGSPMMNKRAPRRSDEEWHQIILAARASGLSDFEYCRDNSIPTSTFYRALARLRQQACELPARSERLECKQEVVQSSRSAERIDCIRSHTWSMNHHLLHLKQRCASHLEAARWN